MDESTNTTTTTTTGASPTVTRRRPDPLGLAGGAVFVAVAVTGLTDRIQLSAGDVRWLGPTLLVAFGILLVATAAGSRSRSADRGPGPQPATDPGSDAAEEVPAGEEPTDRR